MPEPAIRVIGMRLLTDGKPLKAFADIQLNTIVLRDFRVMQANGGKPYIKVPFTTYKDKAGNLRFRQIIELPDEVRGQVDTLILSAFYREKEKTNGERR
jgi:DNA-binding cell septation regulator SpoVG